MTYNLNRLDITGPLTVTSIVPVCVMTDIADAHDIAITQYSNCLETLRSLLSLVKPIRINLSSNKEWLIAAKYVNRYVAWPKQKLQLALARITMFHYNARNELLLPDNFQVGLPQPNSIETICPSILYCICVKHAVKLEYHSTLEYMTQAVRLIRQGSSLSRRVEQPFPLPVTTEATTPEVTAIPSIAEATTTTSIKQATTVQQPTQVTTVQQPAQAATTVQQPPAITVQPTQSVLSHETLKHVHKVLSDITALRLLIDPKLNEGAVALAALIYKLDISKSSNPLVEYNKLKTVGLAKYEPQDKWLQRWYKLQPNLFNLTLTFNNLFPEDYYSSETLANILTNNGYNVASIVPSRYYEFAQVAYLSSTFYHSPMPGLISTTTTIFLEDLADLESLEYLCYGSLSTDQPMVPVTIAELIATLDTNKDFSDPFNVGSAFDTAAIAKLKLMCNNIITTNNSTKIRGLYSTLYNTIELINDPHNYLYLKDYTTWYYSLSQVNQTLIQNALGLLLELAMYMRGWLGSGKLPVTIATVSSTDVDKVDTNVLLAINKFELACSQVVTANILKLPLLCYRSGKFHVSQSEKEGLTIGDRLTIVKQGNTVDNIKSCIRLSSNWFAASAHKYMTTIGIMAPFDIDALRSIS